MGCEERRALPGIKRSVLRGGRRRRVKISEDPLEAVTRSPPSLPGDPSELGPRARRRPIPSASPPHADLSPPSSYLHILTDVLSSAASLVVLHGLCFERKHDPDWAGFGNSVLPDSFY